MPADARLTAPHAGRAAITRGNRECGLRTITGRDSDLAAADYNAKLAPPVIHVAGAGPERPEAALPDAPLITIEAGRRPLGLELRELFAHRDLFYFLAWRDVKIRYKQTVLGAAWAVLQPLLTMVIFTVLFGRLARVPSDGEPYAIFSYAGLLPWSFFSTAVTGSSSSLVGNSNLITKVYFPRLIIPGASVGAALVDFLIASSILFVMMPLYGVRLHASLLMFPVLVVLTMLLAVAIGLWASALTVKYRDVRYALPFAVQTWMFLTPIIYPVSFVPGHWRWLLVVNPLSGIIESFRAAVFGKPFNWLALSIAVAITLVLFANAMRVFRRLEREFADII
jgi:homopolymeric O-antigen transport system permease protein